MVYLRVGGTDVLCFSVDYVIGESHITDKKLELCIALHGKSISG